LREDLEFTPWHIVDLIEDPDDSLWCWEYMFKKVISEHIKTRKVKVRTNNQPWINGEIRKALNERYKLLQRARLTSSNHPTPPNNSGKLSKNSRENQRNRPSAP